MACAQVLAMNSTDWVARFATAKDATPENSLLAIEQYGKCYDARTDRLAAALGKQGQGPLIGARGSFRDFEAALRDFTTKALTDTQPPASSIKTAYASLYKKQFRYSFYQSYSEKLEKRPSSERSETAGAFANAPHTDAQSAAKPDTDPLTLAKNRFGEILAALPEDNGTKSTRPLDKFSNAARLASSGSSKFITMRSSSSNHQRTHRFLRRLFDPRAPCLLVSFVLILGEPMKFRTFYSARHAGMLTHSRTITRAQSNDATNKLARDIYKQLIEINTTDSMGSTTVAAEAMAQRLRDAGYPASDVQVLGPNSRKGNLVARLRGTGARKPMLLICHLDVVEARREDWSMDPFQFLEKDGYFYGRGSGDIKDGDAILMTTMIRLKQEGFQAGPRHYSCAHRR